MYLTVCPLRGTGSIPGCNGVFQRIVFLADHTLPARPEPAWQEMVQSPLNGTTQPVDVEEEGRSSPWTDDE